MQAIKELVCFPPHFSLFLSLPSSPLLPVTILLVPLSFLSPPSHSVSPFQPYIIDFCTGLMARNEHDAGELLSHRKKSHDKEVTIFSREKNHNYGHERKLEFWLGNILNDWQYITFA